LRLGKVSVRVVMQEDMRLKELHRLYEELDEGQKETLVSVAKRLLDIKRLIKDSELSVEKKEKAKIETE
jgi:Mlc titration factor MtfA (ptsG expression regulator)